MNQQAKNELLANTGINFDTKCEIVWHAVYEAAKDAGESVTSASKRADAETRAWAELSRCASLFFAN